MKRYGITLVEVLIVIGVLGILMGMASPLLRSYIEYQRITQAVAELAGVLRSTGGNALTRNEGATVTITTGTTGSVSYKVGSDTATTVKLSNSAYPTTTTCSGTITYTGRGLPLNQCVITVQQGTRTRSVTLLVTGKVVIPQ